ncbi:MAG TPA: hypothetical protein VIR81_06800 [Myxococcales bacterium]|nr:hypothetical protein [Myxococcales bacterium]
MRRTLLALLFSAGCIAGSPAVQRDDRVFRALAQQERWTQDALARRPTAEQLDAIRNSDYAAVGRGRAELKRLLQAADRGTWIRETTAELMRDDSDPRLLQQFERGGRLRADALGAADELAGALAEAKGGLTIADLRPGFEALRKAQASEDRLARMPVQRGGVRLQAAPLPIPRPLIAPAARVVAKNPELTRELDRLPADDAAKIRAQVADLDRGRQEQKPKEPPAAVESAPVPAPEEKEAEAPSTTLTIANDAASLIARKAPRSITLREDGLFALAYDDAEYLVDPQGKLVRKEAPPPPQR